MAAGAGDQAAGALGVGVTDDRSPASLVLGTSGVIFTARNAYTPDPEGRLHAFCHALPDTWHVMGVILSAAGALSWLADTLGASDDIAGLLEQAAAWPPGVEGLTFAPYLSGERTPYPDSDLRGGFVGLGLRHDRGALARAVLEGVAYALRDGLDLIAATGRRPEVARVSGGGARSELWLKILASVLELPLGAHRVRGGRRLRRGAARRRGRRRVRRRARRRSGGREDHRPRRPRSRLGGGLRRRSPPLPGSLPGPLRAPGKLDN